MYKENIPLYIMVGALLVMIVFLIATVPIIIYDEFYVRPIASERANQYCINEGFDFYESYSRVGILSKEPVAIICKYVEQYRNVDLNINKQEE